MLLLVVCFVALLLGFLVYSRFVERPLLMFRDTTPAVTMADGVDYVPLSRKKNLMIELLNIAGTGPIFGALMGAKWGPIVFIWIVVGTIFGGAVHDYMCGMMSIRNDGKSASYLVHRYLGDRLKYPLLLLVIFVLIMVSATFARSASDLLETITGVPMMVWIIFILIFFVASALLPIDKLIGRIYPVFGILLILMAVTVLVGLIVGGFEFPTFSLENQHPDGKEFFPDMFITVACGAISGFHATQAPMVSRCLKDERDGRIVFYGAMVVEAVIALLWATAGLAFYGDTMSLAEALGLGGASGVVYDISSGVAGSIGGLLAVIGVIICPITSGDTALRSARMMVQDDNINVHTEKRSSLVITIILMIPIVALCFMDFTILWNYFSWLNQTLACMMLWTATVFILQSTHHRAYALITAVPAIFMTMIVSTFILHSSLGLSLDYNLSLMIGAVVTIAVALLFTRVYVQGNGRKVGGAAN